ncbi:MAG: rod shape-determining protein MreD [Gammaproteobacteria bacterium]|nr:rod shape-determining protein MreD [Gammaproteobacteria bacterium]
MTLSPRRGGLVILLSFIVALLLTVIPLPETARLFRPQWTTLVLIYWSLALPQRVGVGVGWTLGLFLDVMTGTLLGQHALALSLIAFITLKIHLQVRLFPLWQQSSIVLALLLIERLIGLWTIGATSQPTPSLLYWVPPLIGMLLWPWVFIILRDLRRSFQVS